MLDVRPNSPSGWPRLSLRATLFRQARAGCSVSLNALMARHESLVQAVVRRQVLGELPFTETLQAGRIGLWRAVKAHPRFRSPAVPGEGRLSREAPDSAAVWEATVVCQALHDLVHRLPRRLQWVVVARYGLDGSPPAVYRQIGAAWG